MEARYHLEPEMTLCDDRLVVRVEGRGDREILEALKREESRYQTKQTGRKPADTELSSPYFHISPQKTTDILQAIAATGALMCKGKAVVCDFYSKNTLTFLVDEDLIIGQVRTRTSLFEISDSPFIGRGSPHCFLDGITLRFLTSELPWKVLKKIYTLDPPPNLEEVEACVIKGDLDTPQIESFSKGATEALPVLTLKDRTGAFADLWLDNGTDGRGSQWEKDLLETGFARRQTEYFCPLDQVREALALLLELGWEIRDWEGKAVKLAGSLKLSSKEDGEAIVVTGTLPFGDEEAGLALVAQEKTPFISLSEQTVGLIPKSSEIQHLAAEGEIVMEGIRLKKAQAMSVAPVLKQCSLELFEPPRSMMLSERFHGRLRPYQQEGVDWLAFLARNRLHGILADDMGLGKTVQALAYLSTLESAEASLAVMPASLLHNWKSEASTFYPGLSTYIHHGLERTLEELPKEGLILTTYGTLLRDLDLFEKETFQCLFLDEAQTIKNRNTKQFQAVCALKARFRCCMTGTPIENRLEELFSHFHFLIPDLLQNSDPQDVLGVKRKTKPFILRRSKEQVAADLPEKIEQDFWICMPEEQRSAYDQFLASAQQGVLKKVRLDGMGKHRMEIFEILLRLRQICCHPQLIGDAGRSGKLDALLNDMQTVQEEGKKALIFSQFTSMLTLIKRACQERGMRFCYLDGKTKQQQRMEEVERFQNDPEVPFFLISLKAGGVGLNLTAADYVFLFDPWWNPAVERQAIDRAHRIGREGTVIAKRYLCKESVEEKMFHLNTKKRQLAETLLDESPEGLSLSEEDLFYLLD